MEYLKEEYNKYHKERRRNKSFEAIDPLKSQAFNSLLFQVSPYLPLKSKILEVGFGSGYFLSLLAQRGHHVRGIDNSFIALKYAREVFREKKVKGKLKIGDGFKLSFEDNYFDFVFSIGLIEHYSYNDQKKLIKEMIRVSKDLILISTPNPNVRSLYQNFKKFSEYIPEKENFFDFKRLLTQFKVKVIKKSGFHMIARIFYCNKEFKQLYKEYGLGIPKKEYYKKDLKKLLNFENKLSDRLLYEKAFLRYVLVKKN